MMKANVKGLVIALLVPLVLGQCSDRGEEVVVVQTDTPQVFDDIVVKRAVTQRNAVFYLTSEYPDAEWTVYSAATGTNKAAGVTAVYYFNGTMLELTHDSDIHTGDYFVAATEPGKSESGRLKLSVLKQEQTVTPTTSIASVAKADAEQASVSFTLDNAAEYSSAARWILYSQGTGATGRIADIRLSLKGDVLTLTHNQDVPEITCWLAVVDDGKSECNPRLKLSITAYDPERTPAPLPVNTTVTKTSTTQASVAFAMLNAYSAPEWKLYTSATGESVSSVTPSFSGTTLTLTQNPDVPEGAYFITATDDNQLESARVKLTVNPYVALPTATPMVAVASVVKTATVQRSVDFTLTNNPVYPSMPMTRWKVYIANSGSATALNISAAHANNNFTLTHSSDIPAGNYWISATEGDKTESGRLALRIIAFTQDKTPTPTVASASVIKTAGIESTVDFTLTNSPNYPPNTQWKVYATATDTTVVSDVTALNAVAVLTLRHSTDVPEYTYYVSATENGKAESDRLALTVIKERTAKPTFTDYIVSKTAPTQPSVDFTLINDDPAEYPPTATQWKLYGTETGTTPLSDVTIKLDRTGSNTLLTLTGAPNITARDYWLAATVEGKTESVRVRLTVVNYIPGVTPTPMVSNASLAKTFDPQPTISFTLDNASAYSSGYTWKVYTSPTNPTEVSYVSVNLFLGSLVLADVNNVDIPIGDYWVTATENGFGGTKESDRLMLSVLPAPAPEPTVAPIAYISNLAKSSPQQSSVAFTIDNTSAYVGIGCTWKVYPTQISPAEMPDIILNFNDTAQTLTLRHSPDIPATIYWVSVTEPGKTESDRLALRITPYVSGVTPTPEFAPTHQKSSATEPSVSIPFLNAAAYSSTTTTWKIYSSPTGSALDPDVSATFNGTSLSLTHATDVPTRSYWITATNNPNDTESARRKFTVIAYTSTVPVTVTPNFATPYQKTSAIEPSVSIPLLNASAYLYTTKWKVYYMAEGPGEDPDISATFNGGTSLLLTSTTVGDVRVGHYWITATNDPPNTESARQRITVESPLPPPPPPPPPSQTQQPIVQSTSIIKPIPAPTSITVRMTNIVPYSSNCVWTLYNVDAIGTRSPNTNLIKTFNAITRDLLLTSPAGEVPGGRYAISATEPGELESLQTVITVKDGGLRDVESTAFYSAIGSHTLNIALIGGTFVDASSLSLQHFKLTTRGTPGFPYRESDLSLLVNGSEKITLVSPSVVAITDLTPVRFAGSGQKITVTGNALATQATAVLAVPNGGSGSGLSDVESAAFTSAVGNYTLTITLDGGTFMPQPFLSPSQFILSTRGTGGFNLTSATTVIRLSNTEVIIPNLDPVSVTGSGQKITVSADAIDTAPRSVSVAASGIWQDWLAPVNVFVMETKSVPNIGFIAADPGVPLLWSLRNNDYAALSASIGSYNYSKGGYDNVAVSVSGRKPGTTFYTVRTTHGGRAVSADVLLTVDVSTTWYVGPYGIGTYGFADNDIVTLFNGLKNIRNYYGWLEPGGGTIVQPGGWPDKGFSTEAHAKLLFTSDMTTENIEPFDERYPKNIDLASAWLTNAVAIGKVTAGTDKIFTLEGLDISGGMEVESNSEVTMKPRTVMRSIVTVRGKFSMEGGVFENASTEVYPGAKFTVKGGTINSNRFVVSGEFVMNDGIFQSPLAEVRGAFTIDGGTFKSPRMEVRPGSTFTLTAGATVDPSSRVYVNGSSTAVTPWPPALPYTVIVPP